MSSTGVEQALTVLATINQDPVTPTVVAKTAVIDGDASDAYTTSSLYMGDDLNVPGFTAGRFVGMHYQITSTGTSVRQSTSVQNQGAYVIQGTGGGNNPFGSILP